MQGGPVQLGVGQRVSVGVLSLVLFGSLTSTASAQSRVESNVIYGMYSGLALLMDVHHPDQPNGYGLVLVPGSGWHRALSYAAEPITGGRSALFAFVPTLLEGGNTLFVVNHRAAPRFRWPAAFEDVQRAVRFVRAHAENYGIDGQQIGAVGYSSGAHLVSLLGVVDGVGNREDPDPINRVSASVQCVVASATPTALGDYVDGDVDNVASFMGQLPPAPGSHAGSAEARAYREASPITHVSGSSAPILLIHGDADEVVPFRQSELMVEAAEDVGATVKLIRVPGGGHGFARNVSSRSEWPDVFGETNSWLQHHLANR